MLPYLLNLLRDTALFFGGLVIVFSVVLRGVEGLLSIAVIVGFVWLFRGIAYRLWALIEGIINHAR